MGTKTEISLKNGLKCVILVVKKNSSFNYKIVTFINVMSVNNHKNGNNSEKRKNPLKNGL